MDQSPSPLTVPDVNRLLEAGLTDEQIAAATGHTTNWCKCFRNRHGLPCNPEPRCVKLNPVAVQALVEAGWSGTRIAVALGAHKTSVYDCMRRQDIKPSHTSGRKLKAARKKVTKQ